MKKRKIYHAQFSISILPQTQNEEDHVERDPIPIISKQNCSPATRLETGWMDTGVHVCTRPFHCAMERADLLRWQCNG